LLEIGDRTEKFPENQSKSSIQNGIFQNEIAGLEIIIINLQVKESWTVCCCMAVSSRVIGNGNGNNMINFLFVDKAYITLDLVAIRVIEE